MQNRAFLRALHSLTHPLSIAAILLLLFNDHWLRHHHPSWLTGKLGDFTWLIFAPFIAALFFSLVIPSHRAKQELIVGQISFGVIGLWFAMAKTLPIAHQLTTNVWEAIIGWEGSVRIDPTDLVTLPALLLGWLVWKKADSRPRSLRPIAYISMALGIVATLASDEPYYAVTDFGITNICEQNGQLMTTTPGGGQYIYDEDTDDWELFSYTRLFTSDNGGLSWREEQVRNEIGSVPACPASEYPLVDLDNKSILYGWQAGKAIEISTDGGQTWILERDLYELGQDVRSEYNHRNSTWDISVMFRPGPLAGVIHTETGNIVLAMGWDGVMVRTPNSAWQWVTVGEYGLADLTDLNEARSILFFEFWQAGALVFLVVTTAAAYMNWRNPIGWGMLVVGWGGWFGLSAIFLEEYHLRGGLSIGLFALPLLIFIAIPLSSIAIWTLLSGPQFRHYLPRIVAVALASATLFLIPFIPWTQGTIPRYTTALLFALLLVAGALLSGGAYLRRILPLRAHIKPIITEPETSSEQS